METKARLIGFSSGSGGVGTSSCAVALGRIIKQSNDIKILYISFDTISAKCASKYSNLKDSIYEFTITSNYSFSKEIITSDKYGLEYLSCDYPQNSLTVVEPDILISLLHYFSNNYDIVLLDIPIDLDASGFLFEQCTDLVLCYGYDEKRFIFSDDAVELLKDYPATIHRFKTSFDEESFKGEVSIYGEFGAEVRRLAQEIQVI